MEVMVLEASNPPSKPVLAVHAGPVRRQAKLDLHRALQLPRPDPGVRDIEVKLFQQVASQVFPADDCQNEVACEIPIQQESGTPAKVKLVVRREGPSACKEGKDTVGATKDYLEQHNLQQHIQLLIQGVLRDQPGDPYTFMVERLKETRSARRAEDINFAAGVAESAPMPFVPKPPAKPPPSAASFRKVRNHGATPAAACPPPSPATAAVPAAAQVCEPPACQEDASEPARARAHNGYAREVTPVILEKALQGAIDSVSRRQCAQVQARAVVRALYFRAAATSLPAYKSAVGRWAVAALLRSATDLISADEEKRRRCFAAGAAYSLRASGPAPVVTVQREGVTWGSWLNGGGGK